MTRRITDKPTSDPAFEAPPDGKADTTSLTRRSFLGASAVGAAALLDIACGTAEGLSPLIGVAASGGQGGQGGGTDQDGGSEDAHLDATPACEETEDDIEGPFYKANAPENAVLADGSTPGVHLSLSGRVLGTDCEPLGNALLDFWQADDAGAYDSLGFVFRGKVYAGAEGRYQIETIIPGHYLNGAQYRPAHIHVKASAPGHVLLTTQLYFEGDPYNGIDPFIKDPLIMSLADASGGGKAAVFDFVLLPV